MEDQDRPRLTYRRVLAIDPATKTGWALVDADGRRVTKVIRTGIFSDPTPMNIDEFARKLTVPSVRPDVVVIEDQYFGRNIRTLISLTEDRTRFQHSFEVRGRRCVLVPANDWQIGMLGKLIHHKSKRDERKRAAKWFVNKVYNLDLSTDEADALTLATYAVHQDLISRR